MVVNLNLKVTVLGIKMSAVFAFTKPKALGVTLFTSNGKRCCSLYSTVRDKEKRIPNFDVMEIPRKAPESNVGQETEKPERKKQEGVVKATVSHSNKVEYRKNILNIQMLSKSLHHHIFGDAKSERVDPKLIEKAKQVLQEHGLLNNENQILEDVLLDLPPLKGKNIAEHFWIIGEEQCKPYRELVQSFIKTGIPKPPSQWLCEKGWTKYVNGEEPVAVPFPDDDIFVFDVEVCVTQSENPVLATAVSSKAWYAWICHDLAEGTTSVPRNWYNTSTLIPFEGKTVSKEKPRIIVGHNVSYDRRRIKEQYYFKNSALRFLDTMSLHTCIGGINRAQKSLLRTKTEIEDICLCSLKELYLLYCKKELDKKDVITFVEGTILDVKKDFQALITYCSSDVIATYEVLQAVFPIFLNRFTHPVTLAGMLEMGSAFLTVNQNWNKFLKEADHTYDDLSNEISSQLSKKCDKACRLLHNDEYKNDLWMWNEDWSTQELKFIKKKFTVKQENEVNENVSMSMKKKVEEEIDEDEKELLAKYQYLFDLKKSLPKKLPFLPGYPLWYRKLCEKSKIQSTDSVLSPQLTTSYSIAPKLLNITWENFPVHYVREYGWGILIPDLFIKNVQTSVPFEKLKELTIKNCNIDMDFLEREQQKIKIKKTSGESSPVFYYNGSAVNTELIVDDCCLFFKIPHVSGEKRNVGNPLSKEISHVFASGTLSSSDTSTGRILDLSTQVTYWRNNRQRIYDQMVVWLNKKEAGIVNESDENYSAGVIIPQVVVCGTLTRRAMDSTWLTASKVHKNRIGSELRAMIQAPPGYHFVGADVDSQELWIASLIGDSYFARVHGSTPLGWMTLSGNKSSGTDMHSVTAKAIGISRSHAKVINYARIYGASVKFAEKLLKQFNPALTNEEAQIKAVKMYNFTKGVKEYKVKDAFVKEFTKHYGKNIRIYDLASAMSVARRLHKNVDDVFQKSHWMNGTESSMFNRLEQIATSKKPTTPFLRCRISRALEPKFEGDSFSLNTRINWVVQSGAVDFLHLMLVCMKWLTNGKARYCFSFHDEVRYMIPTEERYNGALALHITNLFVRSFCSYTLGMYDLPQTVAFFSAVEVDKTLRKEANDDCVTSSNPRGLEQEYGIGPGETLDIYETIRKSGGSLAPFGTGKKRASCSAQSSQKAETIKTEMSRATKRKHVHREILEGELVPPKENQKIVRVLSSKGSNLHEVETPESTKFLASMPMKFRKNVWIKRGDFIVVEPIEEGGKVKAEIVNILTADYIRYLKKENIWPKEFSKRTGQEENADGKLDDLFVTSNWKSNFSKTESN